MKYCTSCGKALQDDTKFCISCGSKCVQNTSTTSVSAVNTTQPSRKRNTKRLARNIILITIVSFLTVALIVSSVLVIRYNSTEQKVLRALDAGEYDEAIQLVSDDPNVQGSVILRKNLIKRIKTIKDDFTNGTIEYSTACMELDTIEKFDMSHLYYGNLLIETRTYIEELNNSRAHFEAAESFYAAGDWGNAIENYQHVIENDSNYTAATNKIAEATINFRNESLTIAADYVSGQLLYEAIVSLKEALYTLPNDKIILEQINLYQKDYEDIAKQDALTNAAEYADNGDYLQAFQTLEKALERLDTDPDDKWLSVYNQYCDQYVEQILASIDAMISEKNFDNALSLLYTAQSELPKNNEKLSNKLAEVNAKRPVPITNLLAVNTSHWGEWNSGSPTDPFGNDYSAACNYIIHQGYYLLSQNMDHYTEYRLYGSYASLSGTFATQIDSPEDKICRLQIYADDVLVFTSEDFGRKTDALNFKIDVRGVEYIKIIVYTEAWAKSILSDVQLWP